MTKIKKVAFIIAFRGFKDEEYLKPKAVLESGGVEVETFSNKKGVAIGSEGEGVVVKELDDLGVVNFHAIIFVGGPGALDSLDNEKSYAISKETLAQNKILAAICISPVILSKAGVLENKKATAWTSSLNKKPRQILKDNNAIFIDKDVIIDGNIITANGPSAANDFGQKILDSLQ